MALERQDSMMDQLSMGLNILQQQSSMISEETGLHSQLLNDMENNIDNAHEILVIEVRRAAQLRAQDGQLWKLQLTVASLFVTFVFVPGSFPTAGHGGNDEEQDTISTVANEFSAAPFAITLEHIRILLPRVWLRVDEDALQ